jgi:hypothetical protein
MTSLPSISGGQPRVPRERISGFKVGRIGFLKKASLFGFCFTAGLS